MVRRILIVESDSIQKENILSLLGEDISLWRTELVSNTAQAFELLEKRYFDLVLCGMNIGGLSGADFLNEVLQRFPRISRLLIGPLGEGELLTQCAFGMHQMVLLPCDTAVFRQTLERIFAVEDMIGDRKFKTFALRVRTFPSIPSLYFRIVKEIQSPEASADNLAELIKKDLAVTTKMLQAANSAFYGLQQQVTQIKEAIVQLGMETIKTLVLSIQVFSQFDKVKPIYFSIDSVWRHCHAVADRAKKIALEVVGDARLAEEAFTAGLLHDIGKAVLACNCEKQYRSVLDTARRSCIHETEAESNEFGLTHAETGGYLASQLGMPTSIIEAITLHHQPSLAPQMRFSPLTAVHIADFLEHQLSHNKEGIAPPKPDLKYLESLGLSNQFQNWLSGDAVDKVESPISIISSAVSSHQKASQAPAPNWSKLSRWWPLAASCIVTFACGYLWFGENRLDHPPQIAHETDRQPDELVAETAGQFTTEPAPMKKPPMAAKEHRVESSLQGEIQADTGLETNQPMANSQTAPSDKASPVFRLQGIMYNARKPIAMVNERWVSTGGNVDDAEVLSIDRTQVILRYAGRNITLLFR